ncbi:MAG: hypothetical protein U5L09_07245 [Bacteroidales bacterium]|nr:hypothetical protein [Bacteroidales bacterium]
MTTTPLIVYDMMDFDNAVGEAMDFSGSGSWRNPLIVVTSDHETGGMSVGSRSAKYSSFYKD